MSDINLKSKLIESGIFEGMWWLPDKPENKIFGIATLEENKRNLRLFGSFKVDDFENNQTIYGENPERKVTLFDCSLDIMRYIPQEDNYLTACNIWFGDIVEKAQITKEQMFSRISFKLPYVDMLMGQRFFSNDPSKEIPKTISFKINQPFNGTIKIGYQNYSGWNRTQGNTIKETFIVDIEFEESLVRSELIIVARNTIRLINLLYRRNISINDYNIRDKNGSINVRYKSSHSIQIEAKQDSNPRLHLNDMNEDIGVYFSNWLKHTMEEEHKYLWIFEVENSYSMFMEQKFLSLVQSIDGIINEKYPTQEEFVSKDILKILELALDIETEISSKDKKKVLKKLERPIPNSLSQRLKRLTEALPDRILRRHKDIDIQHFCDKTNSVRNYLSHLSNYKEENDIKHYPYEYILFLKDILYFLLFKDIIGINEDMLERIDF